MKENQNMTIEQYCTYYEGVIYVWSNYSGKWKSERLSDLPEEERQEHIERWKAESRYPSRVLEGW